MTAERDIAKLLTETWTVPVLPQHDHGLSRAEEFVISTGPIQRLRRMRQMELAYHAFPLAEYSRFSHSVGTVYWAVRMLRGLKRATGQLALRNNEILTKISNLLGPSLSLELIVRLYALVHDIALLPLGHTLRLHLARLHGKGTFRHAFGLALTRIHEDARAAQVDSLRLSQAEWHTFERHLALVEVVAHAPRMLLGKGLSPEALALQLFSNDELLGCLPVATFVYDLVHGVYAADLLDFCSRDLPAIGGQWSLPEKLFDAGAAIVATAHTPAFPTDADCVCDTIFRYGIDCRNDGGPGLSALYQLASAHRARLELVQAREDSHRKSIADAMLDKAMRKVAELPANQVGRLNSLSDLLEMGDDEFLDVLYELIPPNGTHDLVGELRRGQLFESALILDALTAPDQLKHLGRLASTADGRSALEAELAQASGVPRELIIVAALPEGTQGKVPTTLVAAGQYDWQPIHRLARESGMVSDLATLSEQYLKLRRFMVLVHPSAAGRSAILQSFCQRRALACDAQ